MDIYIADKNLRPIAVIDSFKSVIWNSVYCGTGDFEIYIPASRFLLQVFKDGCFVYRKDSDTIMVIEKITLKTDEENGNFLIITGRSAECILDRRIIWKQTNLSGTVTDGVKQLINENIITPEDISRKIYLIQLGNCISSGTTLTKQITGDNLLETITEILSENGIGFRLRMDSAKLLFELYQGADRSINNKAGNPVVMFSPEFDNFGESEFTEDYTEYKNVCLVAGEGEGTARKTETVGSVSGLDRREMYYEDSGASTNDGEISDSEYSKMLKESGNIQLAEKKVTKKITGEIVDSVTYTYGTDYFLGDIVSVKNEYGMSEDVRITGRTENLDENGTNVVLSYENL